jgi:hypothetical protein
MIGGLLPKSAQRADWWDDSDELDPKAVQRAAWSVAGFTASLIPAENRARFDRMPPS